MAAHWHEHFSDEAGDSDKTLNDQAVCFFQIAAAAGLGEVVVGRRGAPTRLQFDSAAVEALSEESPDGTRAQVSGEGLEGSEVPIQNSEALRSESGNNSKQSLGQGIFVAHGKNKKPLEQLKKILDQFKIPYRVAVDEPNLGRPIGAKVKETMESCNCAVLIFTADEEFQSRMGPQFGGQAKMSCMS